MCSLWISGQREIIFIYIISWLVSITETECLLRGTDWGFTIIRVNINPLNAELNPIRHLLALVGDRHIVHIIRIRVNLWKGCDMAMAVSRRSLTAESSVRSQVSRLAFVGESVALWKVFLRVLRCYAVSIILSLLHAYLHVHTTLITTRGHSFGNSKAVAFRISRTIR